MKLVKIDANGRVVEVLETGADAVISADGSSVAWTATAQVTEDVIDPDTGATVRITRDESYSAIATAPTNGRIMVSEIAGIGWVWDGDSLSPPSAAEANMPAMRSAGLATMLSACDRAGDALLAGIPLNEQKAFSSKEAAARAVLAGQALPHHELILAAEAAHTGETLPVLATLVVARADALSAAVGTISGLRRISANAIALAADQAAIISALATLQNGLDALLAQAGTEES